MSNVLVTPPAVEPITIEQARLHLKEDTAGSDIDAQIMLAVKAVREICENDCRRAFITQTWKLVLDAFPRASYGARADSWSSYGSSYGGYGISPGPLATLSPEGSTGYELYLPRLPIISIDSIAYTDASGVAQVLNTGTDIAFDLGEGLVLPTFNTQWPQTQSRAPVSITYTCGYGPTPATVPACAISWMLMNLGTVYEMRQAEMAVYRESLLESKFVDRLLDPLRVRRY